MTAEEIAQKLAELEAREKSNTRRLDKLENDHEVLARLATSLEVMATKQENISDKLDTVCTKVDELERVPAKRWRELVGYILAALASAGVTWLVTWISTHGVG